MSTHDRGDRPAENRAPRASAPHESDEAAYQAQWEQYRKLKEELMNTPGKSRTQSFAAKDR